MISVIIPHYKGREKLLHNLTHNLPFLAGCEVVVVNDNPVTPLKQELAQMFPEVVVIENEKNLGFAGAVATGIKNAKNPFVFLLNDDVTLKDSSFKTTTSLFKDSSLFAVSFAQIEKDKAVVGRNRIFWSGGFFRHSKGDGARVGVNGWAEGGAAIFDKKKYEMIGGFDESYSPFYWEDIDLSYRAWKAGFTILFDPQVTVEHHHESTIGTHFQKPYIETISYRNQLMTIWKNISDRSYLGEHIIYLVKTLALSPFRDGGVFLNGFGMAAAHLPAIMRKRNEEKKLWKKSDREIFKQFN